MFRGAEACNIGRFPPVVPCHDLEPLRVGCDGGLPLQRHPFEAVALKAAIILRPQATVIRRHRRHVELARPSPSLPNPEACLGDVLSSAGSAEPEITID